MKSTSISKKTRSKSVVVRTTSSLELHPALRYAYLLIALILLLPILSIGIGDLSSHTWSWYAAVVQGGYALVYVLIAPALVLLAKGKQLSTWLRAICNILVIATILVLMWLSVGFLQDLIGMQCQGFFGVRTTCADNQYLQLLTWIIDPYVLLTMIGLTLLSLAKGWFDYFYYEDRS